MSKGRGFLSTITQMLTITVMLYVPGSQALAQGRACDIVMQCSSWEGARATTEWILNLGLATDQTRKLAK
jgi:hypothetical protein